MLITKEKKTFTSSKYDTKRNIATSVLSSNAMSTAVVLAGLGLATIGIVGKCPVSNSPITPVGFPNRPMSLKVER